MFVVPVVPLWLFQNLKFLFFCWLLAAGFCFACDKIILVKCFGLLLLWCLVFGVWCLARCFFVHMFVVFVVLLFVIRCFCSSAALPVKF